ncbi:50S ribosomal protein L22 [Candidatus Gottesmanbacteria bacterium]|nr:50S ribosomal protein L22 [Candidatus Gottesmanbacteria bacterium]
MEYQATAKYLRISTRKVRLLTDQIRTMKPENAMRSIKALPNRASKFLSDVIASALANAKQKNADTGSLRFKTIEVMGASFMKRMRAVSKGQGHAYKKRMTHIRVILFDER